VRLQDPWRSTPWIERYQEPSDQPPGNK
jgi:hypothetical protein